MGIGTSSVGMFVNEFCVITSCVICALSVAVEISVVVDVVAFEDVI